MTDKKKIRIVPSEEKKAKSKNEDGPLIKRGKRGGADAGAEKIEFNYDLVEGLGKIGATQREMALFFGVAQITIERRMTPGNAYHDPLFFAAYEKGAGQLFVGLRRKQIEIALNGDRTMLIWLGKNLLGQTDRLEQIHGFDIKAVVDKYAKAAGLDPERLLAKSLEVLDQNK
jgi:hypothetical protein